LIGRPRQNACCISEHTQASKQADTQNFAKIHAVLISFQGAVMKLHTLLCVAVLLVNPVAATAQTLKPGLWESTSKIQGGMGNQMAAMQEQMAKMPPEQRKMMQDMMAKQGATLGAAGPGSISNKVCLTKEMIERNEMPGNQGDCTATTSPRIGNTMRTTFTCAKQGASGEGQFTIVSAEAYTMKMSVTAVVMGKSEKTDIDGSGKWLATDCGTVKPIVIPKK
jgi:Protein of unknown function (DUF3617)